MAEFDNVGDFSNHIENVIGLSDAGGNLSVTTQVQRTAIAEVFGSAFFKNELRTSGAGGEVHWDNVTNKPPLGWLSANNLLFVNPNGRNPSSFHPLSTVLGNPRNTFITIQDAANLAQSGHTIVVDGGVYTENITIQTSQQVNFYFRNSAQLIGNITYPGNATYNNCFISSDGTGKITGDVTIHSTTQDFVIEGFHVVDGAFRATGGTLLSGLRIRNCKNLLNTSFQSLGSGLYNIDLITFNTLMPVNESLEGEIVNCNFAGTRFSNNSNQGYRRLGRFRNCQFEFSGGGFGSFGQITGSYFFQDCTFKTDQNYLFDLHAFAPGANLIEMYNCRFVSGVSVFNNQRTNTLVHQSCRGNVPMLNASGSSSVIEDTDGSYFQTSSIT